MDDPLARLVRAAAALEVHSGRRICVIGGLARNVYAERRATADVDVIVDVLDPADILAHAGAVGLVAVPHEVEALRNAQMTRLRLPDELTGDTRLDVIARSHDYYGRVLDRSVVVEALGARVRVACAEDVVLLKILADRPQDRLDVEALVEAQGDRLDREVLRREAAALELELPASLR